jgi:signal transduction histidine kinase
MASLGEFTAGIAHEIQNPLNFVNNFSEISNELIDEMNEELDKGDIKEAKIISNNIKQNLEKINHHGKRADAIVKGMLQHSRSSSGKKELIDINTLVDEYLRLSYHGLRAKDKSFNANFKTDLDSNLPKIEVVPQDIGRVLLNLITNAFFAVNEKAKLNGKDPLLKHHQGSLLAKITGYSPLVNISTRLIEGAIEITIKDNGTGIPDSIKDKIFQPFFTTKPSGQGTGLGLSLSYDIIKAHGGEVKFISNVGEGTKFSILLPLG